MKRFKLFLAVAAVISGMASCNEDEMPVPAAADSFFDITVTDVSEQTGSMSSIEFVAIDDVPIVTEGSILFYRTSEGRYGKMEILDYDDDDNYKMTFRYTTYTLSNNGDVFSANAAATVRGTWHYNLDEGIEGGPRTDFWWHRVTPTLTNIAPEDGAAFMMYKIGDAE